MSVEFNIARSGYSIRSARPADLKAVRMLLPEMQDIAIGLVAVDGHRGLVIGAAAATGSFRVSPLRGPGVALHVIEPCRKHGVARSLLHQIEESAKLAGAEALYAAHRVEQGSDAMACWSKLGFMPHETVEENILPVDQFERSLGPVFERMRKKGRVPEGARVVPLYRADTQQVLRLHLKYMGGDRNELLRRLQGRGADAFHPRHSQVLLVNDHVKGCLLAHRADSVTFVVDANIVDPQLRGGWANVWLKLESFRAAPAAIKQFRFTSFDHYTDTRSFTKKLGGTVARCTVLMIRPLYAIG